MARKIDYKQWDAAPGLITEISTAISFESGSLAFTIPATILRWRGYVSAMFDETVQAGDQAVLTFGVAIVSTDAVGSETPDPASEPSYPWIWWKEFRLDAFVASGAPMGSWGPAAQRYELDSKAMRKIKPRESLLIIGQSTNVTGAPAILLEVGQLRVLIGT